MDRNALTRELIELATAYHTGAATDDERARLERLLEDNAEARAIYLRIADDTVTLNDVRLGGPLSCTAAEAGGAACTISLAPTAANRRRRWLRPLWVAAASLAVAAGAWLAYRSTSRGIGIDEAGGPSGESFARVLNISNVDWAEGSPVYGEWDRLGPQDALKINRGRIEVLYDNGVQFLVQGPADLTFISEERVAATSGQLVARVSPEAIGFKITTPHAVVIDRGTSFGVTIEPERQTDVVVYEGMVDLALGESASRQGPRLAAGEALRIGRDGRIGRISSVASDLFLPPPSLGDFASLKGRLISAVSDNLQSSQTAKYYRVIGQGFREDCQAFVDRHHQWNGVDDRGIPPFLENCDYVMTFNDDKVNAELRIAVTLARPGRLYVLVDNRVPQPGWLADGFVDTGWDIGIDEGYDDVPTVKTAVGPGRSIENTCSVWARDVPRPSTVMLGPLRDVAVQSAPRAVEQLMYGIVASELPMPGNAASGAGK
jgi:hypothetical protein